MELNLSKPDLWVLNHPELMEGELLDFTVPRTLMPLLEERLQTPSISPYREKPAVVSNVPTFNGRYVFKATLTGIQMPPSVNRIAMKSSEGKNKAALFLEFCLTSVIGAGGITSALIDNDPFNEPQPGLKGQMIRIVPSHFVSRVENNVVKQCKLRYGVMPVESNEFRPSIGMEIYIYASHLLGVRYSQRGFAFRDGEGGRLWYSLNKGYLLTKEMLPAAIEEMSGTSPLQMNNSRELAIV